MTTQPITLNLPSALYERLRRRAERTQRTVEDEALEAVALAMPVSDLPDELVDAIAPLNLLDDAALWRAARTSFSTESAQQLETLHIKRQCEGLDEVENQTLHNLMHQYERAMLVRAEATRLLKQRGHDVSPLLNPA